MFQANKVYSKHRGFLQTSVTFSGSVPDWNVQMFMLHSHTHMRAHTHTQVWAAYCVRSWRKIRLENPLNCVPFTWFKYIVSISLINISKKVNFETAQKYKCISFTKYIQPLIRAQSFNFRVTIQGTSFLLHMKAGSHLYKVIYMGRTNIDIPFPCPWQLCMECWKWWKDHRSVRAVQRLAMRNLLGAPCTPGHDHHLLETRLVSLSRGTAATEQGERPRMPTASGQRSKPCKRSNVDAIPIPTKSPKKWHLPFSRYRLRRPLPQTAGAIPKVGDLSVGLVHRWGLPRAPLPHAHHLGITRLVGSRTTGCNFHKNTKPPCQVVNGTASL